MTWLITLPPTSITTSNQTNGLRFQAHLSKCGPCQAFVGTLSSTISALGRLPGINAPSALKQSLLERMRREN